MLSDFFSNHFKQSQAISNLKIEPKATTMNAFQSSEVRWFYRRNRTEIEMIRHWFMNLPNAIVEHQSMRVDYYYRLSQSPRFGIKLRMEGGGKAEGAMM